jgi:molybdate transport system substrate-binding protein
MIRIISFLLVCTLTFASTIHIAVAANVSYVIKELVNEFNKQNPSIRVKVSSASSGKLTAQIKNYAPYELFMSANMLYPNELYKTKYAITKPKVYAKGSLAILSPKPRDLSKGVFSLLDANIQKIAIANPKTAPYGKAAKEALQNAKIYNLLKSKFIYGESISTTLIYTIKAADVGIVAKSLLYSPNMKGFKEGINYVDVDKRLYTPIKQGVVILKNAKNNIDVVKFYNFLFSNEAKKIFRGYGYIVDE